MGKSEVVPMPIHKQDNFYAACQTAFKLPASSVKETDEKPLNGDADIFQMPDDMEVFTHQVAGHTINGTEIGMIKHNGTILKPILNDKTYEKEMNFYETINSTTIETLSEIREFTPKYYGHVSVQLAGKSVNCIVLEDLTRYYKEPCVMDIKIGRRTWDPTANYQKIMKEELKYQDCKRDLAFCIPGFQVYNIETRQLCKYDKDYGKQLNKDTVPQTLKTFLNGDKVLCRSLIVQFLACLWRIQLWLRKQRHYHFYSSSLLFVYDARRLRELLKTDDGEELDLMQPTIVNNNNIIHPQSKLKRSTSLYRPLSLAVLNNNNENEKIPTGFSGQFSKEGPILKSGRKYSNHDLLPTQTSNNCFSCQNTTRTTMTMLNRTSQWQKSIRTLKRTHSFQNDYDKEMQYKKQDYTFLLDELSMEQRSEEWATVKMIDFAHVYPAEHYEIDRNYLEGVDNLIRLFEEFLADCE